MGGTWEERAGVALDECHPEVRPTTRDLPVRGAQPRSPASWRAFLLQPSHSPASDAAHGTCAVSARASAPPAPRPPKAGLPRRPRAPAITTSVRLGVPYDTPIASPGLASCPAPASPRQKPYARPVTLTATSVTAAITDFSVLPATTPSTSVGF